MFTEGVKWISSKKGCNLQSDIAVNPKATHLELESDKVTTFCLHHRTRKIPMERIDSESVKNAFLIFVYFHSSGKYILGLLLDE